jgi:two-component system chemotaxis response regulator CheY
LAARTVLIVDDDEDFRSLLRMHLETHGFEVVGEATNGAAGVSEAFRLNPAFLTLDQQMPYLTGEQALEHIREIRPHTKVVVVSGTLTDAPDWADVFLSKDRIRELGPLLLALDDGPPDM